MPKRIGYARVSTDEQTTDPQRLLLEEARCDLIFADEGVSGVKAKRPALDAALAALEPGDTLVIVRLDRLGRSLRHLVELEEDLRDRGVQLENRE